MARTYHIISADSHLDLSPEQWKQHVPEKWKDQAPKVVRLESGEDAIVIGERAPDRIGFTRSVGVARDQLHLQVPTFENSGGTGQPEKRLREQDQDGVDAEILFSRIQGTLRRVKDDECYEALVHAYNEYLIEEYAAAAPDRLITMGVIPRSGIEAAMRELEYCAKAGFKGVLIDKFPSGRGRLS
jgi:predicted TIM-barrel fold metal-dependent hydrolase